MRKAEGWARRSSHGDEFADNFTSFGSDLDSLGFSLDDEEEEDEDEVEGLEAAGGGAGGVSLAS